jgi:hypothetical protein
MRAALLASAMALGAAVTGPLAAEDDELVFAPTEPWTVDYDSDSCALRRTFR